MTRAEYLTKRGWTVASATEYWWASGLDFGCTVEQAVTIQRARDAADERAAWVAFAAGWLAKPGESDASACAAADYVMDRYRARFAAPDRFDDEVTP